jgi:hypothetical protein
VAPFQSGRHSGRMPEERFRSATTRTCSSSACPKTPHMSGEWGTAPWSATQFRKGRPRSRADRTPAPPTGSSRFPWEPERPGSSRRTRGRPMTRPRCCSWGSPEGGRTGTKGPRSRKARDRSSAGIDTCTPSSRNRCPWSRSRPGTSKPRARSDLAKSCRTRRRPARRGRRLRGGAWEVPLMIHGRPQVNDAGVP